MNFTFDLIMAEFAKSSNWIGWALCVPTRVSTDCQRSLQGILARVIHKVSKIINLSIKSFKSYKILQTIKNL